MKMLLTKQCVKECEKGFYIDESGEWCLQCMDFCKVCENNSTCIECFKQYGMGDSYHSCNVCEYPCSVCSTTEIDTCVSCAAGYSLQNGICLTNACKSSEYVDRNTLKCRSCSKECSRCSGPTSAYCIECADKYSKHDEESVCTICGNPSSENEAGSLPFGLLNGQCIDICGDGKRFNKENAPHLDAYNQCDDGNMISGDGCSFDCQVEQFFQCEGGSPTSKDTCIYAKTPQASIKTIAEDGSYIDVLFDEEMTTMPDGNSMEETVTLEITNILPENYDYELKKISSVKLRFELSIYQDIDSSQAIVSFLEPTLFKNEKGVSLNTTQLTGRLPKIEGAMSKTEGKATGTAGGAAAATTGAVLMTTAMVASAPASIQLLVLMERIVYFMFLNIQLPKVAENFLNSLLAVVPSKFIPQPFNYVPILFPFLCPNFDSDVETLDFPSKFEKAYFDPLYFQSVGGSLCIFLGAYLFFLLNQQLLKRGDPKGNLHSILTKIQASLKWGFFLGVLEGTYMDFVYGTTMQLLLLSSKNAWFIINGISAAFGVILVIILPFSFLRISNQSKEVLKSKIYERNWGYIYSEFKYDNFLQKNFITLSTFKNLLFVGSVVLFFHVPILQMICINATMFSWLLVCIKVKPYKEKTQNVKLLISEGSLAVGLLVIDVVLLSSHSLSCDWPFLFCF